MANLLPLPRLLRTTLFLAATLICTSAHAESRVSPATSASQENTTKARAWRFVVFGDTRDVCQSTPTGVSARLELIAKAIAEEKPDLVIHTGDLINGYYTTEDSPVHGNFDQMFKNWKTGVKPIFDFSTRKGIPLYVVRGNHEDGKLLTDKLLKEAYEAHIGSFMPQNGPENEKGLTYSIQNHKAIFVALDEYSVKEFGFLRGLIDLPWLKSQLPATRASDSPVFVFGHVPAFKVASSKDGPFPDLYSYQEHRNTFWKYLDNAGARMYFCGHVHFYCRLSKDNVQQVLVGNGGANVVAFDPNEVDPSVTLEYPTHKQPVSEIMPGYLVVTVQNDGTVTARQKLWDDNAGWIVGDEF